MDFNFNEYINFINEKDFDGATIFRLSNIPKPLYKYFYLNDSAEDSKGINEMKFSSLEKNQIWLSTLENLNDPFESRSLILDKEPLVKAGWSIEKLEKILKRIRDSILLTCFSSDFSNNMPMWAHYTNNHKGFCIEYNVIDPKTIYPVSYENNRISTASVITNYITKLNHLFTGEENVDEKELRFYHELIFHSSTIKHSSWKYEKEYRVMETRNSNEKSGTLKSISELGLEISKIYVGAQCNAYNKQRLNNISQKNGWEIYEMFLDEYTAEFSFSHRKLEI